MKRPKNYLVGQELKVNPIHPVIGQYMTSVLRCTVIEYEELHTTRDDYLMVQSIVSKENVNEDGEEIQEYVLDYVGTDEKFDISPSYIEKYDLKVAVAQMARENVSIPVKDSGSIGYNNYIEERDRLSKVYFEELKFLIDEPVFVPAYFLEARTEPTLPEI